MNKELLQQKLSRTANQYFIDEFKGAYPVDEMGNILEAFKAGAKEILDNPDKYWNWSMVKLFIEGLKKKIEGLASKEQSEFAIDVYNSHIGDLHTALRVIDRYCDTTELGETYVQKDKYDECIPFNNYLREEYLKLQKENKELQEKITELETVIAKISYKILNNTNY